MTNESCSGLVEVGGKVDAAAAPLHDADAFIRAVGRLDHVARVHVVGGVERQ